MRSRTRIGVGLGLILLALGFSGGCSSSPPSTYYALSPLPQPAGNHTSPGRWTIALGPVSLPEVLERPQLIMRGGSPEVRLAERHRWAAPLRGEVARVIGANLAALLTGTGALVTLEEASLNADFRVAVEVSLLEGHPGRAVLLEALWSVRDLKEGRLVAARASRFEEPFPGEGFVELVTAHDRLLVSLSREIAAELTRCMQSKAEP